MRKLLFAFAFTSFIFSCNTKTENSAVDTDKTFTAFEDTFLDAYWKQYPSLSINIGYGRYYDHLLIPDSAAYAADIAFCNQRLGGPLISQHWWFSKPNHL